MRDIKITDIEMSKIDEIKDVEMKVKKIFTISIHQKVSVPKCQTLKKSKASSRKSKKITGLCVAQDLILDA